MLFSDDGVFVVPAFPTEEVVDPTGAADYTPMAQSVAYEILGDWHGALIKPRREPQGCLDWHKWPIEDQPTLKQRRAA